MNVEPEYNPLGGLVAFHKSGGDGLVDALCQLLAQPVGGDALLLWLAANLTRSAPQGLVDWLSGFDDIRSHDATLANMIHALIKLVVDIGVNEHDQTADMLPSLRAAVHRRIAQKLYGQPPLDPSQNEIRLLRVEPPDSGGGDAAAAGAAGVARPALLRCSLVQASLDDAHLRFDALSYAWGDTANTVTISVDGKVFLVTANLYAALHDLASYHLAHRQKRIAEAASASSSSSSSSSSASPSASRRGRPPTLHGVQDRSFLLWVDAICINQQDVAERNSQVALMARLYERAESVRIYVGPEGPKTAAVFASMAQCGGGSVDDRAGQPDPPGANMVHAPGLADVDSGSLHGLVDLLARTWWTRLWVVQEAALARSAVLHCGRNLAWDFRRLQTILDALHTHMVNATAADSAVLPAYRVLATTGLGRIQRAATLLELATWRHNVQPRLSHHFLTPSERRATIPTNLLDAVAHRSAALSHDRIYGVLGLAPPDLAARIAPDYTAPVERVFEDATMAVFHWAGRLDLLRLAGRVAHATNNNNTNTNNSNNDNTNNNHPALGETLPSWVPAFGHTMDGRFTYRSPAHFRADMGVATCLARRDRPGELVVRGLVYDYVASVAREPLGYGMPPSPPVPTMTMPVLLELLRKRLREWRATVGAAVGAHALTAREFWQTLTTDRIVDPREGGSGAPPRRWTEVADMAAPDASADALAAAWDDWLGTDGPNNGVPARVAAAATAHANADQERLLASVWEPHQTASMFVTAARRPGLADASGAPIRAGDVLAVLAGLDEPCILRPMSQNVFRFVQTCYCRGAMDGEVLAEAMQRRTGPGSKKIVHTLEAAISANYHGITRAQFREEQPKAYWAALEKAINPLFEEIRLV